MYVQIGEESKQVLAQIQQSCLLIEGVALYIPVC